MLTHSSGFPAWKPFYLLTDRREKILSIISSINLETEPKKKVIYSDLNFITLCFLLEKLYGLRIDEIVKSEIIEPLDLIVTFFNPLKAIKERIAASEKGNEFEKNTCLESRL